MFQTEVDVQPKTLLGFPKTAKASNRRPLTFEKMLDQKHMERQTMLTSFDSGEDRHFKGVVSNILKKSQLDVD